MGGVRKGSHMAFREELEEKIAELREAAMEAELVHLQNQDIFVDEDGQLIDTSFGAVSRDDDGNPVEPVLPSDDDRVLHYNEFQRLLDDLVGRFEFYYDLDVHPLEDISQVLGGTALGFEGATERGTVHSQLRLADQYMNDARDMIHEDHWAGDAAAAFSKHFMEPFDDAITLQQAYAQELNLAAMSIRELVSTTAKDIKKIADAAIVAFRGEEVSAAEFFGSIAIILGATGFLAGPGALAAIELGADFTSAFLSAAEQERGEQPVPLEIVSRADANRARSDPRFILNRIWEVIDEFQQLTADRDYDIMSALLRDLWSLKAFAHPGLIPHGPDSSASAYAPDEWPDASDAFEQSTIPSGAREAGVPVSDAPLVVELVNLYEAGLRTLPNVAFFCDIAIARLDECTLPDWVSTYMPRLVPQFHLARDRLKGQILLKIHEYLEDTAPKLVSIASDYELVDEEEAERLRQTSVIDYQHDPPPIPIGGPI
jgi:hypothetical protein